MPIHEDMDDMADASFFEENCRGFSIRFLATESQLKGGR
jgi:hypothetical protein